MTIRIERICRTFSGHQDDIRALDRVNLEIKEREFVVVRGPSGCGKTTLLLTLGGMLRPTSGRIWMDDQDLYAFSGRERSKYRAQHIGFVFQMFHLIPYLSVLENVALASGKRISTNLRRETIALIEGLGLSHRIHHKPPQLSAGEKQRTAIARALLNHPKLILADEPTGNLDPENAREVLNHLSTFHQRGGTVLMVTHGLDADQFADRIVYLRDGMIAEHLES